MIKELLKKSLCFVSLLLLVLVVKAQDGDVSWSDLEQLDGYTIEFEPVHATCFNNGGLNLTIKSLVLANNQASGSVIYRK